MSFLRFQYILHDSGVLLLDFKNFQKLKKGDLISWWEPILQSGLIIWSTLLYFAFKTFKDKNSLSFIICFNEFCMIQEYFSQTFKIFTN